MCSAEKSKPNFFRIVLFLFRSLCWIVFNVRLDDEVKRNTFAIKNSKAQIIMSYICHYKEGLCNEQKRGENAYISTETNFLKRTFILRLLCHLPHRYKIHLVRAKNIYPPSLRLRQLSSTQTCCNMLEPTQPPLYRLLKYTPVQVTVLLTDPHRPYQSLSHCEARSRPFRRNLRRERLSHDRIVFAFCARNNRTLRERKAYGEMTGYCEYVHLFSHLLIKLNVATKLRLCSPSIPEKRS